MLRSQQNFPSSQRLSGSEATTPRKPKLNPLHNHRQIKIENQSQAKQDLQKILDECKVMKGNSYGEMSEVVQKLKIELGIQLFQEKYKQLKTVSTADKMHSMNHNLPNILKTIYAEDKLRMVEQSEDEMAVLKSFVARKFDTVYFKMLEGKK